ncbi:MAG: hypothetical protein R2688_02430 [Fimbriimonadaceae bacterium]
MKKTLISIVAIASAMSMIACAKKDPLAGTWIASIPGGMGASGTATYTFANPNVTMDMDMMGLKMSVKGTYTLEKDQLVLTGTDVTVDESTLPPEIKAQWGQLKSMMDEEMKKPLTYTVTFTDDNTATLKGGNGDVTITRKK